MSAGIDRARIGGYGVDAGEILSIPEVELRPAVARIDLAPEVEAASVPSKSGSTASPVAPLTRLLGPALTIANPAWSGDPVPRMRALQKVLVEHSLTLEEGDRAECMAAISVVERAVRLRLRLQQMRMTEAEMEIKTENAKSQ